MTDRHGCALCAEKDRRIAELEKALKPFADMAKDVSAFHTTCVIHKAGSSRPIKVHHLHQARAALEETGK